MKKIYIDLEFKCHTTNPEGTFREIETDFFDGKCAEFIEGYCFIPAGEERIDSAGAVYRGEAIYPWKNHTILVAAQRKYEREKLAEYTEYLKILGVEV